VTAATVVYPASSTCSLAVNLVTGGQDQPGRSAWRSVNPRGYGALAGRS
jgi:hypothetical protein